MRSKKKNKFRKILSLFLQQEGSPLFNAKGAAVGVFSGCFPFFGFQTLIGIFLAKIAKGNLFLAVLGTWISNPLTYIPLYYFNYKVGSIFLRNSSNIVIDKDLMLNDLWQQGSMFSFRLILGSSLVGLFLAFFCGVVVFFIYKKIRKRKI